MTVFNTGSVARTFDYQAGEVGAVPRVTGHYVENIGSTRMRYLA
jgi:oxalate decarboxylase